MVYTINGNQHKLFTSRLHMVGGSLRVLRLFPPLKLVAMILLKVALNIKNQNQSNYFQ